MTVNEYLNRRNARQNTHFRVYPDGKRVYVMPNQEEVPEAEFLAQNDIPLTLVKYSKNNPDKRHDWLRT